MDGFERVQRGKVGDMTAGLPLGPWTEELADRLKAQLEIIWQKNGITDADRDSERSLRPAGSDRQRIGRHFPKYRPAYRNIYYADRASGGGAIQDVLTHAVNAGEFLVGPVERVMANAAHQVLEGVSVEDTVHVIVRHRGHVMGCYSLNQHQAPNESATTVICERGTARFELNNARWLSMTEPGGEWKVEEAFSLERDDLFTAQANYYLDMLEGNAPPLCTIEEALQTLRVSLAILRSSEQQTWHEIEPA